MKNKWDVFVSYASRDLNICRRIIRDLRDAGLDVLHDESAITGGARLRDAINRGIRNCKCIVVLLSSRSLRSEWVLNELDAAMLREIKEKKTLVIPVLLGKLRDNNIPEDLRGKHHIDLRFNFKAKYRSRRDLLLKSIQLIAPNRSNKGRGGRLLGGDFISFIYSAKYVGSKIAQINGQVLDHFIEAFLHPPAWDDEFAEALKDFQNRYGREAIRKLLLFVLDGKGIDFVNGFTKEEIGDALSDAQWIVMMMTVHEHSKSQGHRGIELRIRKDREITYRLIRRGKS